MAQGHISRASLLEALARTDRLGVLLPILHRHAVEAVKGRSSILFQFDPAGDCLQATSSLEGGRLPTEPWAVDDGLADNLFRDRQPIVVADMRHSLPALANYLGTSAAVLVPLTYMDDRIGVLAVGCGRPPAADLLGDAAAAGHAFALALARTRTTRATVLQQEIGALLQEFSAVVSSSLNLASGLEALCAGASRLFGAGRTSVWLHDRRARMLTLSASSEPFPAGHARQVSSTDASAPAAVALRRERAEITPDKSTSPDKAIVTVPLKGRRRALGTLMMEDVRLEPDSELELLERADEMGRQLSAAVENVVLLDGVLRSRRELDNTFDSLADLVVVSNRAGRVTHVNQAFSLRAGKPRQELIDRPLDELFARTTRDLLARALEPPVDTEGGVIRAEIRDAVLDGTFLMTITPLLDESQQPAGAVLVASDVTPHAQLEAERAELRNKLIQSEKLAALGQFVAGIAHELNNPLQGVLGHLELMRATGAFPKSLRRDVQTIYREADRAAKIVRNLLVFAGSRRLVRKRVSVNAVLARVFALRAAALRAENIELVYERADRLPRVKADPLMLHQAFLNIALNAEQAIGMNGRIVVSTALLADPPRVLVEIRDTGPGLSPDVLPRIFEPFYTTKEVGKGTGLGLAIAYGIIQEHGGQIAAANHAGGGALFTVHLPGEPTPEPG